MKDVQPWRAWGKKKPRPRRSFTPEFKPEIVEYIAWYNGTRLHCALGYMTPDEYEHATGEEGHRAGSLTGAINPVRQLGMVGFSANPVDRLCTSQRG